MNKFNKLIKHVLTDFDNETYDTGRVLAMVIAVAGLCFQGYAVAKGQTFDIQAFLTGFATYLAGLGVAVFLDAKGKTTTTTTTTVKE